MSNIPPEIASLLTSLRLGEAIHLDHLTVVPLLGPGVDLDVDLLDESVPVGRTTVREVSDRGDVNQVLVEHSGARLLLLLAGQQILGAKQNRVFNTSLLVREGPPVAVPVSCVERGRWQHVSDRFVASETTVTTSLRSSMLHRVTRSTTMGRGYDAGQNEVWDEIQGHLERTQTTSGTAAFDAAYQAARPRVDEQISRLAPAANQLGAAVVRDEKVLAIDVLATPSIWARCWKTLLRGVLAEADRGAPSASAASLVAAALQTLHATSAVRRQAPGGSETVHGTAGSMAVGAVVHSGHVVHLSAA
ncbi:MAG: hypothetical protein IT374_13905 [Polyangiaceae bacterium]|nr:hypothetical protein [Polyangiaceae bacterium]